MIYLLNTFLGFLAVQLSDIITRDKGSEASPEKFNILFFIKDTWLKILLSLLLSGTLSTIVYINFESVIANFDNEIWGNLIYVSVGAFPEFILQKAKDRLGFTQPKQVNVQGEKFVRK